MASKSKERKFRRKLKCTVCDYTNYFTPRNDALPIRLELEKYCKHCKKHTLHKETK